jgi:dihydrofolate reductase
MAQTGAMLLGRRTYEDFYRVWPHRTDNPFTEFLNGVQKYVASRTLTEPLAWQNSTLLPGDAADAVTTLKHQPGPDLVVIGSSDLVASLARAALVDEYLLLIHPLILGIGRRLFPDGTRQHTCGWPAALRPAPGSSSRPTTRWPIPVHRRGRRPQLGGHDAPICGPDAPCLRWGQARRK